MGILRIEDTGYQDCPENEQHTNDWGSDISFIYFQPLFAHKQIPSLRLADTVTEYAPFVTGMQQISLTDRQRMGIM